MCQSAAVTIAKLSRDSNHSLPAQTHPRPHLDRFRFVGDQLTDLLLERLGSHFDCLA